jgi:hypothetical protein
MQSEPRWVTVAGPRGDVSFRADQVLLCGPSTSVGATTLIFAGLAAPVDVPGAIDVLRPLIVGGSAQSVAAPPPPGVTPNGLHLAR